MRYVERLYNDNIVRDLLRYSDELSTIFWTEFALYGAFVQSLQNGWGHCFEQRSDLIYYSSRQNFCDLLQEIAAEAPLMIKFRRRSPRDPRWGQYDLGRQGYAKRVAQIKRAYQQGSAAKGAR